MKFFVDEMKIFDLGIDNMGYQSYYIYKLIEQMTYRLGSVDLLSIIKEEK